MKPNNIRVARFPTPSDIIKREKKKALDAAAKRAFPFKSRLCPSPSIE
jgi:hypothetical protein